MPNVKSAEKQMRVSQKRRLRNRAAKSALKTSLKRAQAAFQSNNAELAKSVANQTISRIGRTGHKRVISRNKAARLQSRIQRKLNQALASPTQTTT